jgi:hypothetical protein
MDEGECGRNRPRVIRIRTCRDRVHECHRGGILPCCLEKPGAQQLIHDSEIAGASEWAEELQEARQVGYTIDEPARICEKGEDSRD